MATTRPPRVPNDQVPAPVPAPAPAPAVVPDPPPSAPRRGPPPPPNPPKKDTFLWYLGAAVGLTLLCLVMAFFLSDKDPKKADQLFEALVSIAKFGCGAIIGLVGGRTMK